MKDDWSVWRHLVDLLKQFLTPEGVMLALSVWAVLRALSVGPEWAAWPAIAWNVLMVYNRTGRWLIPKGIEAWLLAKMNGAPKPPAPGAGGAP